MVVSVNVYDVGAVPGDKNGGAGQNAAIQGAIDYVAGKGGGEVIINDDYWIKAHVEAPVVGGNTLLDEGGIAMKSGVRLRFTARGVFRVIPNSEWKYQCIRVFNKTDVWISGPGRIIGDRGAHGTNPIKAGEWGYGISVQGGSNINICDVTVTDMWGDGIDITFVDLGGRIPPKNVTVERVTCDNNRRQGLSLEAGDWVKISDSRFVNTGGAGGTLPMNGIDVEPSSDTTQCSNVTIERCWFENNSGYGCSVYMLGTRDVMVTDCDFVSNKGAHQFVCNLAGPNVSLTQSRFTGTAAQCVQLIGGEGRVIAGNVFDHKVRVAPDPSGSANIARKTSIRNNRFTVNATSPVSGLVEINEHATHTEVVDNHFENKGARGLGVWVRIAAGLAPLSLQHVKIAGNTFINMSNAIITGDVQALAIEDNTIHASGDAAIYLVIAKDAKVVNNRITGSNLISGTAAIRIGPNAADSQFDGNKVEIEPAVTVAETRRGTHVFRLDFGPTTNCVCRSTHVKGALSMYTELGTRTGTYLESTPGTWV